MQGQVDVELAKYLDSTKRMCITGLKKTAQKAKNDFHILELDELYWFIGEKSKTQTKENVYLITMVSREPRQIVGFDVALDKSSARIQKNR